MTAIVLRGDARALPLPDASVDLIVTSPPYFGLRSYTDGGEHYGGQIGSEATPQEYVAALVECTAEFVRVLKPSGSMFVNLGDKFAGGGQGGNVGGNLNGGPHLNRTPAIARNVPPGAQAKSLLGLPWRYALACTDQLGLILRRDIVWSKPNGLPESVTDRCRSSHEYVFHMVKQPRYYAAVDEIREQYAPETAARYAAGYNPRKIDSQRIGIGTNLGGDTYGQNPLGKLPGSVWDIPSQPLTVPAHLGVDHFAAFPMELPRRCVLGWSPPGVCVACGEGRRPVHDGSEKYLHRPGGVTRLGDSDWQQGISGRHDARHDIGNVRTVHRITGYACACPTICRHCGQSIAHCATASEPICRGWIHTGMDDRPAGRHYCDGRSINPSAEPQPPAPTRPAIVLDPFGGTGTTALVASMHGRTGVSIDRSADYTRLARWRTTDPGERAKALQVPKPPPVTDGQDALFAI